MPIYQLLRSKAVTGFGKLGKVRALSRSYVAHLLNFAGAWLARRAQCVVCACGVNENVLLPCGHTLHYEFVFLSHSALRPNVLHTVLGGGKVRRPVLNVSGVFLLLCTFCRRRLCPPALLVVMVTEAFFAMFAYEVQDRLSRKGFLV